MAKDSTKVTVRTVLQTAIGFAVALPAIVSASGVPESLPWVAGALAVAGGFARVMALPSVQGLLPGWLRTDGGEVRE
jgi:predicted cobalt transporter CbtA